MKFNYTGHFSIGSIVIYNRRRYEVNQYVDDKVVLIPHDFSGAVVILLPFYMRGLL